MTDLWDQLALTESKELHAFALYIAHKEEQRLIQFLMAFPSNFEGLRGSILHHSLLPSVDSIVSGLLANKICLKSRSWKGILSTPNYSILAVLHITLFPSQENKRHTKVGIDECRFCKQKGHWKAQCLKLANRALQQYRY
uniref:Uncharacterized protein n=1 Tax=Cannabis sativa TaxID=3483 RepID=A0A803PZ35_CANSA